MMRIRALVIFFGLLGLPGILSAQTKVYGTLSCGPTTSQLAVTDSSKSANAAVIPQQGCSWDEPVNFGDFTTRDAQIATGTSVAATATAAASTAADPKGDPKADPKGDPKGNPRTSDGASYVIHLTNGDQVILKFEGVTTADSTGSVRGQVGNFTFSDGTGALKGITGKGHYTALPRAAGGASYEMEGEYTLPSDLTAPPPLQATPTQQLSEKGKDQPGGGS